MAISKISFGRNQRHWCADGNFENAFREEPAPLVRRWQFQERILEGTSAASALMAISKTDFGRNQHHQCPDGNFKNAFREEPAPLVRRWQFQKRISGGTSATSSQMAIWTTHVGRNQHR